MDNGTELLHVTCLTGEGRNKTKAAVARESPVTIILNGKELVTLLCSPTNLEYLVVGYLSSEGFLESKNEIKSCLEGNNRCYYPVQKIIFDAKSEYDIRAHKLNNTQEQLLDTIQRYPGITQRDLILRTGFKRITIGYHIRKLIDFSNQIV